MSTFRIGIGTALYFITLTFPLGAAQADAPRAIGAVS